MVDTEHMVAFVAERLSAAADPERAVAMAAYLKTDDPFYGVGRSAQKPILADLVSRFPIGSADEYEAAVRALWAQPHREEKYLAIDLAKKYRTLITTPRLPLYRTLIVEGAWWDFVDAVAAHLVGRVLLQDREIVAPQMRAWIADPDMWIRRTAILSQLTHKTATDEVMLFEFCLACAHEKEFFIRKAIGWALRQYARVAPEEVAHFVVEHRDQLAPLSFREATKHLGEMVS